MRRHGRRDTNHRLIVKTLRDYHATVVDLGDVGGGCPDLLVGFRGRTYLVEVKNIDQPPSGQKLTPDQELFHAAWRGAGIQILRSKGEAEAWCQTISWAGEVPKAKVI